MKITEDIKTIIKRVIDINEENNTNYFNLVLKDISKSDNIEYLYYSEYIIINLDKVIFKFKNQYTETHLLPILNQLFK